MVIAVNTRVLSGHSFNSSHLVQCIGQLAAKNPGHRFIIISAEEPAKSLPALPNLEQLLLPQQSNKPLFWKFWYSYTLPAAVRKLKADILISADGMGALRSKLPQCILVNDLQYLDHPGWYGKKLLRFLQATTSTSMDKAVRIVAASNDLKNAIVSNYHANAGKIAVVHPFISTELDLYKPGNPDTLKEQYSQGREYFLFAGTIHPGANLTNLLKAFSLFKKRQKSSMQLLLASTTPTADAVFADSLRLYKYRNDVQLLPEVDPVNLQQLIAAAYAVINLSPLHSEIVSLLTAIKNNVPVIALQSAAANELLGESALFVDAGNPADIAASLMLLYKDENARKEMIEKGAKQMPDLSTENTAAQLWQVVLDTIATV